MGQTRTQAAAAGVFDAQSAVERLGADMAEMRTDIAELKNTAAGIREIQSEMVTMEALDALMKKYLPTPVTSGAAFGGVNPKQKPNPRASGTGFRSPGKPVALADITNTGRPNPPRSIAIADVLKENAKLRQELAQLRFALHATQQRNVSLAQANSQMTAELNQGKERLQLLRHELGCATAVIKLKGSGLEPKSTTADNQLQKEVASQELNAAPSKLAPVEAHQAVASVPCNTVLEEGLTAKTNKRTSVSRRTSKRKSESCEGTKDTTAGQPSYKPAMQPPGSSRHEDLRNTLRRRLREALHMDTDPSSSSFSVPELSSSFSVPELHETNSGKDMQKARQGNTPGHKVETSVLNEKEMNKSTRTRSECRGGDPALDDVAALEPALASADPAANELHEACKDQEQSSGSVDGIAKAQIEKDNPQCKRPRKLRRPPILWSPEEIKALKDCVHNCTEENGRISWVKTLKEGGNNFNEGRVADDLKRKYIQMQKGSW